jgi:hypothetical protein
MSTFVSFSNPLLGTNVVRYLYFEIILSRVGCFHVEKVSSNVQCFNHLWASYDPFRLKGGCEMFVSARDYIQILLF